MSKPITQKELESYLWDSAVLLRNHIDAGAYKQYIFPLLFFKRLNDVYEEETALATQENGPEADSWEETHRFVLPKDAHWNSVRQTTQDVGAAIQAAFRAIEKANPDKLDGIFGDGTWTNKRRLPDRLLKDLLEHFSSQTLSLANCPEDELGRGYEYLIKSIYDPTCGSAGMLVSSIAYLKEQHKEWRNVSLYGQEFNALTCAIGRMNLFLHGIADFHIANGDTLAAPAFVEAGRLKQFDVVLANPPYSISQWNRRAFEADPYGRNILGLPPQGRADYAFFQHILKSMRPGSGRCAILFPHGVLFRNEEKAMREKLVRSDLLECVIGLGPNLFYNSPMEACIVICRTQKPDSHKGHVLFINAVNEVTRKNAESFLEPTHIETIRKAYNAYQTDSTIAKKVSIREIEENGFSLSIPLYVRPPTIVAEPIQKASTQQCYDDWSAASAKLWEDYNALNMLMGGE